MDTSFRTLSFVLLHWAAGSPCHSERANSLLISEHDFLTYLLFIVACGAVLGLLISARIPSGRVLYAPVLAVYLFLITSPALAFIGQDGSGKADVIHAMWAFPLGLSLASGMRARFGVVLSLLAAILLAAVDEIIQWFLPAEGVRSSRYLVEHGGGFDGMGLWNDPTNTRSSTVLVTPRFEEVRVEAMRPAGGWRTGKTTTVRRE